MKPLYTSDYLVFFFLIFHFSGLRHDDSDFINISSFAQYSWTKDLLLPAFKQSGFANQSLGKYILLPCSLGWFVNASSEANKCIMCPAGKLVLSLTDNTSLNRGDSLDIDILLSLLNVNFIEYQMKRFSFLIQYLKQRDLSDVNNFFLSKEQSSPFFGLIGTQVSGKKSNSGSLTLTMLIH